MAETELGCTHKWKVIREVIRAENLEEGAKYSTINGVDLWINQMQEGHPFVAILHCGECGDVKVVVTC
jgi:hypothetical protein